MFTLHYTTEEWRVLKGFEGYEFSNYGRYRNSDTKHILTLQKRKQDYWYAQLSIKGKIMGKGIHRFVALAFPEICGEYFEGATVNHKDENKNNNCAWNLEWLSRSDNIKYGTGIERRAKIQAKQRRRKTAVYTYPDLKYVATYNSRKEVSEVYNINLGTLSSVVCGKYDHWKQWVFVKA